MESQPSMPRAPEWRDALIRIAVVFVATRLLLVLVALIVEFAIPLSYDGPTYSQAPVLESLTGSDAIYYLGIAAEGYHLEPVKENHLDWVFFPLYPMLVRAASILTLGNVAVAGVIVANLAFLAAMVALYRLSVRYMDHETAVRSTTLVAITPGAVAFAMAYTDGLFLLLAVGAFLAAENRRWWLMGLLYALAVLCRLPGLLLGIPLLVLLLRGADTPRRAIGWLALGPLALAAFYGYLGWLTGDLLANLHAQEAWNIPPLADPGGGGGEDTARFNPLPYLLIVVLLFYTYLLVYLRGDRIPLPYAVLTITSLLTVLGSLRLQSVARYLAVVWPFAWILAKRPSPRFQEAWPILSAGLFAVHAFLHFSQALAP